MELMDELDAEQKRAIEEGLNEDELALFDLLKKKRPCEGGAGAGQASEP